MPRKRKYKLPWRKALLDIEHAGYVASAQVVTQTTPLAPVKLIEYRGSREKNP